MFCPKCGKENTWDAQFCGSCGNTLRMTLVDELQAPSHRDFSQLHNNVQKPGGLTVVIVLLLIGILFPLLQLAFYIESGMGCYEYFLGTWSKYFMIGTVIIFYATSIYCGIGLLRLKTLARHLLLRIMSVNLTLAFLLDVVLIYKMVEFLKIMGVYHESYLRVNRAIIGVLLGWAVKVIVVGYTSIYLKKKKNYFIY